MKYNKKHEKRTPQRNVWKTCDICDCPGLLHQFVIYLFIYICVVIFTLIYFYICPVNSRLSFVRVQCLVVDRNFNGCESDIVMVLSLFLILYLHVYLCLYLYVHVHFYLYLYVYLYLYLFLYTLCNLFLHRWLSILFLHCHVYVNFTVSLYTPIYIFIYLL